MPEQQPNDDGLVPPIKVLRKRLSGIYRADGFAGPTRRYVLIVALLVGMASLPTVAAITAGSKEIDDGAAGGMDVPFLPQPSTGTVIPVQPQPSSTAAPPRSPSSVAHGSPGQAKDRQTMPGPSKSDRDAVVQHSDDSRYGRSEHSSHTGKHRGESRGSVRVPARAREYRHRAVWSHRMHCVDGSGRDFGAGHLDHAHAVSGPSDERGWHRNSRHSGRDRGSRISGRDPGSIISHRSSDRSDHSRSSTLTDRPQNVRSARATDRTHNSRRHHAEYLSDEVRAPAGSYRGSHRAERPRRTGNGNSAAHDAGSRGGGHRAERFHRR